MNVGPMALLEEDDGEWKDGEVLLTIPTAGDKDYIP